MSIWINAVAHQTDVPFNSCVSVEDQGKSRIARPADSVYLQRHHASSIYQTYNVNLWLIEYTNYFECLESKQLGNRNAIQLCL